MDDVPERKELFKEAELRNLTYLAKPAAQILPGRSPQAGPMLPGHR